MSSTATVARPNGVLPRNQTPFHSKCSDHRSVRGLKSGVNSPVSGSRPAMFGPLRRLREKHAHARFSESFATVLFSNDQGILTKKLGRLGKSDNSPAHRCLWL